MNVGSGTDAPSDVAGYNPWRDADGFWYDPEAAEKPISFFRDCIRQVDGDNAGKPLELQPWQQDIIRTMFGWKDEAGHRRYREAIIFVPRKNGKSTLAAGLSLFMLLCDNEARAQCYCAAGTREQASLVYSMAAGMVEKHPALMRASRVYKSQRRITHKDRFLWAVASDDGAIHGTKPHWVCGDEIHVWKNAMLYEAFHTGTGASQRSLECYISTAGYDRESFGYAMYDRARKARDGVSSEPRLLPVLYGAEPDDPWDDPATWAKANPNLGVSVVEDFLRREFDRAKKEPAYQNTCRRLYLNQWVSQAERWIDMRAWDSCPVTTEPIADGEVVWQGLDLSSTTDFTALVTLAKRGDGYKCWGRYWLPEDRADFLARKHNINIAKWVAEGWLTLCPGGTIEYRDYVERQIIDDAARYDVQSIGYDPYNAHATVLRLKEELGLPMVKIRQGAQSMSWPAKRLAALVLERRWDSSGDPVLRWMADNAEVVPDRNDNIAIVKSEGRRRRHIDGVVAAIMAVGEAEAGEGGTIYAEPGAFLL